MEFHLTDDEANKLAQSEGALRKIADVWLALARDLCDQLADMPSVSLEDLNAIRMVQSRVCALRFAVQFLKDTVEQTGGN
jgi:hypothetical protein